MTGAPWLASTAKGQPAQVTLPTVAGHDQRSPLGVFPCRSNAYCSRSVMSALNCASLWTRSALVADEALNALTDPAAIRDHLIRIPSLIESDPRAAVGNAKDLLESTAKLVLRDFDQPYDAKPKLPALIDATHSALRTHAKEFPDSAAIRSLLGGLATTVKGVAELRNEAGTGHGRESVPQWVAPRHARLAVGATTVWVQFALETLGERKRKAAG